MGSPFESGFWISIIITASFILLLFKLRSKDKEPAKLDLRVDYRAGSVKPFVDSASKFDTESKDTPAEKSLNVFFNFNGHSWDAYEVLGVPPGTNLSKCEQAYRALLGQVADDSREFIDLAWEAIQKNQ